MEEKKNNVVRVQLHGHEHSHDHDHQHPHPHGDGAAVNEDLVMLQYMLDHNEHHLDEFVDLMEKLRAQGKDDVADLLDEAIELLEDADIKLGDAVALLKGEE